METIKRQLKETIKNDILNAVKNNIAYLSVDTCVQLNVLKYYNREVITEIFSSILHQLYQGLPVHLTEISVDELVNYDEFLLSDPVYLEIVSLIPRKKKNVFIKAKNSECADKVVDIISSAIRHATFDDCCALNESNYMNLAIKLTNYCDEHKITLEQLEKIVADNFFGTVKKVLLHDKIYYWCIVDLNQSKKESQVFNYLQFKYVEHVICTIVYRILNEYAAMEYTSCELSLSNIISELESWLKDKTFLLDLAKDSLSNSNVICKNFRTSSNLCGVNITCYFIKEEYSNKKSQPYQLLLNQTYENNKNIAKQRLINRVCDKIQESIDRNQLFAIINLTKPEKQYLYHVINEYTGDPKYGEDYLYNCQLVPIKDVKALSKDCKDDEYCIFYNEKMDYKIIDELKRNIYIYDVGSYFSKTELNNCRIEQVLDYDSERNVYRISDCKFPIQLSAVCSFIYHKVNEAYEFGEYKFEISCCHPGKIDISKITANAIIGTLHYHSSKFGAFDIKVEHGMRSGIIEKIYITFKV